MPDRDALTAADLPQLAWDKMGGLLPAIVQDELTGEVLMLGYMSREALTATLRDGRATFHSRSKGRLWQKGETSGHHLEVSRIAADCDGDALLVRASARGPTCHLGMASCFGSVRGAGWLGRLTRIVRERSTAEPEDSYTARLLRKGRARIAQKVGEEGVELAIAGAVGDRGRCIEEAADLIYHMTVLMEALGFSWADVGEALAKRDQAVSAPPAS